MDEALIVRAVPGGDVEFADRRSGAAQPLFPLARVLWFAFGVQQHGPAERAASSLSFELGEQEHTERPVVLLAATESRATGVVCVLCGLQPAVLKVFETTGLTRILTSVTDRAVALETG